MCLLICLLLKGVTVFPGKVPILHALNPLELIYLAHQDWFSSNIQEFWNNEYARFFNSESGIDIDGAWIDMNEPSSVSVLVGFYIHSRFNTFLQFCDYPCTDPFDSAREQAMPPNRTTLPPDPNTPIFGQSINLTKSSAIVKRQHAGDDIMNPPYAINNALPELSDRTAYVCNYFFDKVRGSNIILTGQHNSCQRTVDV